MSAAQITPSIGELRLLHAFAECSDVMQEGVKAMLRIVFSEDSTEDEKAMALHTVADILFSNPYKGQLGMDLQESEDDAASEFPEMRDIVDLLNAEESAFADRLRELMEARGLTQCQLAAKIGVGQPAISNMLKRECRPQMRTVARLAEALGVQPSELWPSCPAS